MRLPAHLVALVGAATLVAAGFGGLALREHQTIEATQLAVRAHAGQTLFAALCETCHGPDGDGAGGAPALTDGSTMAKYPTVAALTQFIQTHMPASDPGSLTRAEAYNLAVWVRELNHQQTHKLAQLKLIP